MVNKFREDYIAVYIKLGSRYGYDLCMPSIYIKLQEGGKDNETVKCLSRKYSRGRYDINNIMISCSGPLQ